MIGKETLLTAAAATPAVPGLSRHVRAAAPEVALKPRHFPGPTSTAQSKVLEPWTKPLNQGSNGQVKIEICPSMTLGGSFPQLFRQAANGVADRVWTAAAPAEANRYSSGSVVNSKG